LIGASDLLPEEKRLEIDQTSVYRAINALDGKLPAQSSVLRRSSGT